MKKIIIGEIKESFTGTPSFLFSVARELIKSDEWEVKTNNPQFLEALEVLNLGKSEEIKVYLRLRGETVEVGFRTAYNYLGDIYDIINFIRWYYEFHEKPLSKEDINIDYGKYVKKYEKIVIDND